MTATGWSSPQDVAAAAKRAWDSGLVLRVAAGDQVVSEKFPLRVRLRGPSRDQINGDFAAASDWVREIRRAADAQGWGLEERVVTSRLVGRQQVPAAIVLLDPDAVARVVGREVELADFLGLFEATDHDFRRVALLRPHAMLAASGDWAALCAVARWLAGSPHPGVSVREIPVAGAHTKLLEQNRGLASALFDAVLPPWAVDAGADSFEGRYGFARGERSVELRGVGLLLGIPWLSEVTVTWPLEALAGLDAAGVLDVVVVENRRSFLQVPVQAGRLVVFGAGYAAADTVTAAPWLKEARVRYWGDIDTHGLAILARVRNVVLDAEPLLMDRETLLAHRPDWVVEPEQAPPAAVDERLDPAQAALLAALRAGEFGAGVRLEQERICQHELVTALDAA